MKDKHYEIENVMDALQNRMMAEIKRRKELDRLLEEVFNWRGLESIMPRTKD
jgi:hypothetical protein